jgi:hypothetical protein
VIGILCRLVLVFKVGGRMSFVDEQDYDRIAQSLMQGHGFANGEVTTAFRPPGMPFFLCGIYELVGHHALAPEVLQALLLGFVPFAVARIARRVGLRGYWPNLAGAAASLHPGIAYSSATLYPTALTALTLVVGTMWSVDSILTGSPRQGALGGLFLGIAGAFTTTFVPVAGLAAVVAALRRQWIPAIAIAAVGFAPALAWMVRNDLAVGAPVIATNGAYNIFLGANDEATPQSGSWIDTAGLPPSYNSKTEVERDRAFRDLAYTWIEAHPVRYALLVVGRAVATFDSVGRPKTRGAYDSAVSRAIGFAMLPWVVLGAIGLIIDWRSTPARIAGASLALVILSSALTMAKPRFRFPCDPLLAVFACVAWTRAQSRWSRPPVV